MKRKLRQHIGAYRRHPHVRVLLVVLACVLALVVLVQLLYPRDYTLPRAQLYGEAVGLKSRDELAVRLQKEFEVARVDLVSGDIRQQRSLSELGAEVDTELTTNRLTDYPLWQRVVPFSMLYLSPQLDTFHINFAGAQMARMVGELAAELSYQPSDAGLAIEDSALVVRDSQPGSHVTVQHIREALVRREYGKGVTSVRISGQSVEPVRSSASVAPVIAQARTMLDRRLTIRVADRGEFAPDPATRASWLVIKPSDDGYTLDTDRQAIARYLDQINDQVKHDAGTTTITLLDGVEQSRTNAAGGEELDRSKLVDVISTSLIVNSSRPVVVEGRMIPTTAGARYVRHYSNTEAGLRAYVDYVTNTQNIRIVVRQLDGAGWSASGRADESIPAASTYKLFVMLRVFDDINSGALRWTDPMLDTDVGGCFERTIVPSTNPCAEDFIRRYGRDELTNYLRQRGFSAGTGFIFSDASRATAGDLARYLEGLYRGTLISGANRDLLLEKMGRQLYRYGVPTGSRGWVQDKVGFLWDYIHDAAIVHHPRGEYVIVVMTRGYSYAKIAEITRQVESIMYP